MDADIAALRRASIALVGMPGVGKTTIGRRIAKALDMEFFDSDEEIERASGRTVAGYFRDHGEAAFRDGERRVIERLLAGKPIILATGGGAFVQPPTQKIIKAGATTLWLKADLDVLYDRVRRKSTRPLLNVEDPKAALRDLLAARNPFYENADVTVNANRGPHSRTLERALDGLREYYDLPPVKKPSRRKPVKPKKKAAPCKK